MNVHSQIKQATMTALLSALFTLVLLLLTNYFLNHSWNLFTGSASTQPFTVEGTSTVMQQPDQALISFSVVKSAAVLRDAQNQANAAVATIVDDLKKINIVQKDIKTSNYSSYPHYDNNAFSGGSLGMMPIQGTGQTITGYTVSENIEITLSDMTKANSVIDVATKDGAENISGPNLTFSQTTQDALTQKARIQAITNAKNKAQALASAAGIRLGRIINIQENNSPFPIIQPMMKANSTSGVASTPTQINPGENTITETITLSYETW